MSSAKSELIRRERRTRLDNAIREWMQKFEELPGWQEWRRHRLAFTLHYDDEYMNVRERGPDRFDFDLELEREHNVVMLYFGLVQSANALSDCEYYFRRYPFSGLPVSRYQHLTYICELYFSRFYEFQERIKKLFNAVKIANPDHGLDVGNFIRTYQKEFDLELRARNGVHHHEQFGEVSLDRVFLMESFAMTNPGKGWDRETSFEYRRAAKAWAERAKKRALVVDLYVDAVAGAVLSSCPFLSKFN